MHTIRQTGGLAGFPKRDESVHDAFGVGHSSTSISAGLGNKQYIYNWKLIFWHLEKKNPNSIVIDNNAYQNLKLKNVLKDT